VPEPEGSSPHSQQPASGPYPEPGESTPHPPPPARGPRGGVGGGRQGAVGNKRDLGELGGGGGVGIHLAQDRDRWRAVVSAVMNLRVLPPRS
jgi:hypothetical protein